MRRNSAFCVCSLWGLLLLAACAAPTPSRPSSQPPTQPSRTEKSKVVDEEFLALKEEGNFQDAVRLAQERVAQSETRVRPRPSSDGDLAEPARPCFTVSSEITIRPNKPICDPWTSNRKPRDPATSTLPSACCNLGDLYVTKGDYARAEPLLQQARELREKALGVNHPDVAALPCQPGAG